MTDTFTSELRDLIDRAFTNDYAGRATVQMVHASVQQSLPDHLIDFLVGKGLRSQVTSYFREQDKDGLPLRPAANDAGEHAQLALFSIEEFAFVHRSYVDRSEANLTQAEKVREKCLKLHGVDIATSAAA